MHTYNIIFFGEDWPHKLWWVAAIFFRVNQDCPTLSGSLVRSIRTTSVEPNFEALNLRMMSWRVAATTKYSCLRRNSLPSKNWHTHRRNSYVNLLLFNILFNVSAEKKWTHIVIRVKHTGDVLSQILVQYSLNVTTNVNCLWEQIVCYDHLF